MNGVVIGNTTFDNHEAGIALEDVDLRSREGGCGPLPEKVDVRKLHAESKAHAERARKLLAEGAGGR